MKDYTQLDHERFRLENLDTLVRGCKGILRDGGFSRGGLGNFSQALSKHVSLSFLLSVDLLRKQSADLRAAGIQIVVHDDDGRDVELTAVEPNPA
ncbi:MAG: hypothetical protein ACRD72_07455 [Candidatus Angelobacter sp.]